MSPQPTFTPKPNPPCGICRLEPIAPDAYHVMWCMSCQEEFLAQSTLSMDAWVARKRQLAAFELQLRSACTGCFPQDDLSRQELCTCACHGYYFNDEWPGVKLP